MKQRHQWIGTMCIRCGITRRPNAKYKGRFDYLIRGAWDFRPITPECRRSPEKDNALDK